MLENMTNNTSNTRKLSDRGHSELLAVYNDTVSSIAFFKSQQWNTTNYAVLIYAAVIGTAKIVLDAGYFSTIPFSILFLPALLILLYGLYILEKLESSLQDKRNRLEKIVLLFEKDIKDQLFEDSPPPSEKTTLIHFFRLIMSTGFLIDVSILFLWKCGAG